MTDNNCTAIFVAGEAAKNTELIRAGTTVYSMPASDKNAEYQEIADQFDIHFLFDDSSVHINFYTVPWVEIFAADSEGGYFATVMDSCSLDSYGPVCYIDKNHNAYYIADNFRTLLERLSCWKEQMKPCDKIQFFASKDEAGQHYEFLDMKNLPAGHHQ